MEIRNQNRDKDTRALLELLEEAALWSAFFQKFAGTPSPKEGDQNATVNRSRDFDNGGDLQDLAYMAKGAV